MIISPSNEKKQQKKPKTFYAFIRFNQDASSLQSLRCCAFSYHLPRWGESPEDVRASGVTGVFFLSWSGGVLLADKALPPPPSGMIIHSNLLCQLIPHFIVAIIILYTLTSLWRWIFFFSPPLVGVGRLGERKPLFHFCVNQNQ